MSLLGGDSKGWAHLIGFLNAVQYLIANKSAFARLRFIDERAGAIARASGRRI